MRMGGVGAGAFADKAMAAFGIVDQAYSRREAEDREKQRFAREQQTWRQDDAAQQVVKDALSYDPASEQKPVSVPIASSGINAPDEPVGEGSTGGTSSAGTPMPAAPAAPLTPTQAIEKKAERLRVAKGQLAALGGPAMQKYGMALDEQKKALASAHAASFQPQEATSDGILTERDALRYAAHRARGETLFSDPPSAEQMLAISSTAKRLEKAGIIAGADAAHLGNLEQAKLDWKNAKGLPGELVGLKPMVGQIGGIPVKTNAAVFKKPDGTIVEVPAIDMARQGMTLKEMIDLDLKSADTKSKIEYRGAMARKVAAVGSGGGGKQTAFERNAAWWVANGKKPDGTKYTPDEAAVKAKELMQKPRETQIFEVKKALISGMNGLRFSGPNGAERAAKEAEAIVDGGAGEPAKPAGGEWTGPRPWLPAQ